jgi:hypothetical protein
MTRRLIVAAGLALLTLGMTPAFAHDDYRIIGTIEKVTAKTVDVKQTKDGKIISMQMTAKTIVTRDKTKVERAELKTGLNVVVDARGDSLKDLSVVQVRLVPPPTAKK